MRFYDVPNAGFNIRFSEANNPSQRGRAAVVLTEKRLRQVLDVPEDTRIMGVKHDIETGNVYVVLEADGLPQKLDGAHVQSMELNALRGRLGERG